jgi:hypothetical protein
MLTEEEYRSYLDQPKHTLAKLKSIAQKIVGTVKEDLKGKTRSEVIDHLLKFTSLDESMNINLKTQVSLINAVKARKARSDKGVKRGARSMEGKMKKATESGESLVKMVEEIKAKPKSTVKAGKVIDIKTKSGKMKKITLPIE